MKFLASIALALLASCATSVKPLVVKPSSPPQVAAVAPKAQVVWKAVNESAVTSSKLESQVSDLRTTARSLQEGMTAAVKEVDRLREENKFGKAETDALAEMLKNTNSKVEALVAAVEVANNAAAEHKEARATAEREAAQLLTEAARKDAENEALQRQNAELSAAWQACGTENAKLLKEKSALEKNAAIGSWIKSLSWAFVVILVLSVVVYGLFRFNKLPFLPS